MEYAYWIRALRKFPLVAGLIGAGGILFDRAMAFFVAPAVLCMFVTTTLVARGQLTVARFFHLGWLTIACFLVCLSSMVFALARVEGVFDSLSLDWTALVAIALLVAIAVPYSLDVWKRRLENLRTMIHADSCPTATFFECLNGPSQIRFWRSSLAWAAMCGVVAFGSWVAYRFGENARATLVISAVAIAWIFTAASGAAQLLLARRYSAVMSIHLT